MKTKLMVPVILLALLGIFLIGKGITGYVISQSCCFPPNCNAEDMCPAAKQTEAQTATQTANITNMTNPAGNSTPYLALGLAFITISIVTYAYARERR